MSGEDMLTAELNVKRTEIQLRQQRELIEDVNSVTEQKTGALIVDAGAAFNGGGPQPAFLVQGGVARKAQVTIGASDGQSVEIVAGARPGDRIDFTPTAAEFDEMDSRPMLRDGYAFTLTISQGIEYTGHTEAGEYGFALRVMCTSLHRPECARFSVSTHTTEQLRTRTAAREHFKGDLYLGQSIRFQVWPTNASV